MIFLGGYVVARPTQLADWQKGFLPDPFLTISSCLMDDVPQPEFIDWYTDRADAEEARAGLYPQVDLLAVGLETEVAARLRARYSDGVADIVFPLLDQRLPLPEGALVLGHEIVGCEATFSFHSWHCHDYAKDAWEALGIGVNQLGLISDHADALRILEWMLARPPEEQPAPVPWTVVTLARCT
jgi:hypothetical protein